MGQFILGLSNVIVHMHKSYLQNSVREVVGSYYESFGDKDIRLGWNFTLLILVWSLW